jgi:hypothetical protein
MNAAVRCPITQHAGPFAQRAAQWVRAFHPDVTVTFDGDAVLLSTQERDETGLRLIWLTGLTNERLLARAAAGRAAVLDQLVR